MGNILQQDVSNKTRPTIGSACSQYVSDYLKHNQGNKFNTETRNDSKSSTNHNIRIST